MMVKDRHTHVSSALVLLAALAGGCGSDDGGGNNTTGDTTNGTNGATTNGANGDPDGGGGATMPHELTLVPILDPNTDNPIAFPHVVRFYGETGTPADSNTAIVNTMSEQGTGKVMAELPADKPFSIHVVGAVAPSGEEGDNTYDAIILDTPPNTGDELLRISSVGLAATANATGNYENKADRAAFSGAIYCTRSDGTRVGTIAGAKLFLDEDTTGLDEPSDQRYNNEMGLPVTPDQQQETVGGGRFFFGNLSKGDHTLRVEVGGMQVAERSFNVPLARQDAEGPAELIIYQYGIDVDESNPVCSN